MQVTPTALGCEIRTRHDRGMPAFPLVLGADPG